MGNTKRFFFLDSGSIPSQPANNGGVVAHPIDDERTAVLPAERMNDVPRNERRDRLMRKLQYAQAQEVLRLRGII